MITRKATVKAAALLLGASLLAGCNTAASTTAEDATRSVPAPDKIGPAEQKEVTVQGATSAPNMGYLPLYVGQSLGLFENEGISVNVQYSKGDAAPLQAIGTGKAQVMSGTPEALIKGYENGLRGTLFYQSYNEVIFSVGVPAGGDLADPTDLEGKNIGVASMASTGVVIAEVLVAEAGGDPDSLNFVPVGTGQQALGALEGGEVDALALWDTPYAQLESAGLELDYWKPEATKGVSGGGYFTSWELIEEKPNTLARFTRAITKSMIAIKDEPEQALEAYWEVNPSAKPKGSDEEAIRTGLQQLDVIGRSLDLSGEPAEINIDAFDQYSQVFVDYADVGEAPPSNEIATNAFLQIAQAAANESKGE